ncbi:MAG: hypothetical protein HOQ03_03480, partial [Thermoleophilia bacterium]|nr:hypothetical protein [Thermoleophilia bacterium]
MDLGRFISVAWRFRGILAIGLLTATLVGIVSMARITIGSGGPSLTYRSQESWTSASTLFITQSGFPWGRAILDDMITIDTPGADPVVVPKYGDPGRYSGLAALYAELAKSDGVQAAVMKNSLPGEYVEPMVVQSPGSNTALPLMTLKAFGPTPEAAENVAMRASRAFRQFLDREQASSGIPPEKRIKVVVTQKATTPELFEKRSMVRPIFLFLLINMGFLALAFALENLRPRQQPPQRGSGPDRGEGE